MKDQKAHFLTAQRTLLEIHLLSVVLLWLQSLVLRVCFSDYIFVSCCVFLSNIVCPELTVECSGGRVDENTPACVSIDERCDGVAQCIGGEDELEHNCPCSPEGEVRLVGGVVPYRGRVEICKNGRWFTTCRYSWDQREAAVVCHQLGYSTQGMPDTLQIMMIIMMWYSESYYVV